MDKSLNTTAHRYLLSRPGQTGRALALLLLAPGPAWAGGLGLPTPLWWLAGLLLVLASVVLGAALQQRRQQQHIRQTLRLKVSRAEAALLALDEWGQIIAASKGCQPLFGQLPHTLQQTGLPAELISQLLNERLAIGTTLSGAVSSAVNPATPMLTVQALAAGYGLPEDAAWQLLLLRDISTEHLQQQQDEHLRLALKGARLGMLEFDLDNQRLDCSSLALHNLLGLPAPCNSLSFNDWLERLHPEDRAQASALLSNPALHEDSATSLEFRIRHENGSWEWLEQRNHCLRTQGRITHIVAMCQIISARKLAEASLLRREQEFRTLVENSPDIIARYDLDLRCQFINRSINRYSPIPREEHIGRHIGDKGWPDELVRRFEQEARTLIETWEARSFETELFQDNRRYIFESRLFPEFDRNGVLTSILCVDREITSTRQTNRLLTEENAVMEMIANNQPLPDILKQICQMIETQLPHGICSIMRLDDEGTHLKMASGAKLPPDYSAMVDGIAIGPEVGSCGTAAYWKRPIIVDDIATSPLWAKFASKTVGEFGLRACWSIPIFTSEHNLLGTFGIYHKEPRRPTPEELDLAYRSTHLTAIALQSNLHEKQLYKLATQDSLTGLNNRRQFLDLAGREIKRSQRYQQPLTVMMLDLDHFKNINDRYGHDVGDQVIHHFASVLQTVLRASDLAGRLGGEEFAGLLPDTDLADALPVAERLRQQVENSALTINGQAVHYTVSIGLTALQPGDVAIDDLLRRADKLLYQAKDHGRNRVCGGDTFSRALDVENT